MIKKWLKARILIFTGNVLGTVKPKASSLNPLIIVVCCMGLLKVYKDWFCAYSKKSKKVFCLLILNLILCLSIFIGVFSYYHIVEVTYTITTPTENQLLELMQGDSQNRLWFSGVHTLCDHLMNVSYYVRASEKDKPISYLKELNIGVVHDYNR